MTTAQAKPDAPTTAHALAGVVRTPLSDEERSMLGQMDPARLPSHVAVIMDGNGRWARQRGFAERIRGHEAGIDSVRAIVRACTELRLRALTLYAFSVENWLRPKREVNALMGMLERFLRDEVPELNEGNVALVASGRLDDLSPACRGELDRTIALTAGNTGLRLNLALSYGGRTEIVDAARRLARMVAEGRLAPDAITEGTFAAQLYHPELGDPDLLIRTSGEMRVSNFLLYEIAYTEIHVTPVFWPDFRRPQFYEALLDYGRRDRRFGKVAAR